MQSTNPLITTIASLTMPKRHNISKTQGGADLEKLNDLHDQLSLLHNKH
jgi:hypothetical protein